MNTSVFNCSTKGKDTIAAAPVVIPAQSALAAALATRTLAETFWTHSFEKAPPKNPAEAEVSWREALLWGGLLGFFVGIAKVAARKGASDAWSRSSCVSGRPPQ